MRSLSHKNLLPVNHSVNSLGDFPAALVTRRRLSARRSTPTSFHTHLLPTIFWRGPSFSSPYLLPLPLLFVSFSEAPAPRPQPNSKHRTWICSLCALSSHLTEPSSEQRDGTGAEKRRKQAERESGERRGSHRLVSFPDALQIACLSSTHKPPTTCSRFQREPQPQRCLRKKHKFRLGVQPCDGNHLLGAFGMPQVFGRPTGLQRSLRPG